MDMRDFLEDVQEGVDDAHGRILTSKTLYFFSGCHTYHFI